jgi:hypothetical protein
VEDVRTHLPWVGLLQLVQRITLGSVSVRLCIEAYTYHAWDDELMYMTFSMGYYPRGLPFMKGVVDILGMARQDVCIKVLRMINEEENNTEMFYSDEVMMPEWECFIRYAHACECLAGEVVIVNSMPVVVSQSTDVFDDLGNELDMVWTTELVTCGVQCTAEYGDEMLLFSIDRDYDHYDRVDHIPHLNSML